MAICEENVEELLRAARRDAGALGDLLEYYRPFLELKARRQTSHVTAARCDAVDIVQETCADVVQQFAQFGGSGESAFSGWIMKIHLNNVTDVVRRHVVASRRSVLLEQRRNGEGSSAQFVWHEFASDGSTPSTRIIRGERAIRLAQLISRLPARQAQAIQLRFFGAMSIREIAQTVETTDVAAASLLRNGLRNLRGGLNEPSWQ